MVWSLSANRKTSIAIKTAISAGTVILFLLAINGIVFNRLESNLVSAIFDEYATKTAKAIDIQGEKQRETLKKSVAIHSEVLGNAAATFIYGLDRVSLLFVHEMPSSIPP